MVLKAWSKSDKLCGNLPLGLRVMGANLRGKKEDGWEGVLHRLENSSLDRKIDAVLRVGYDSLHEGDQSLFLHIAFFFNYELEDHVMDMLAEGSLDVRLGLKTLASKSLIHVLTEGRVVMHKLLQQVGRQTVQRQEPWKRKFLTDAHEIESGSRSVTGISLNTSTIADAVCISKSAFKNMRNLRFLSVYETRRDRDVRVHVHEDMEFPPRLRLLDWDVYPGKCLPRTFTPEYLVGLDLRHNMLEKLWEGIQPLTNLKKMVLTNSLCLKELPELSKATNLERLYLAGCESLVEIPSSIGNLPKLEELHADFCINLEVVPTLFSSSSLDRVNLVGCWQLKQIPSFYGNVTNLTVTDTMLLQELPETIGLWSSLESLSIWGSVNPYPFTNLNFPERSGADDIGSITDWLKDLHVLRHLYIVGCPKLASLPELPPSLKTIIINACESLETLTCFHIDSGIEDLNFPNCFKLGQEARRVITQQTFCKIACLPGKEMPAEFDHRALGSFLTIPSVFYRFRVCLLVTPKPHTYGGFVSVMCRTSLNGCLIAEEMIESLSCIRREHLFIFPYELFEEDGWLEQDNEVLFQFSVSSDQLEIVECGVQILTTDDDDESILSAGSYKTCSEELSGDDYESLSDGSIEFDEHRQ
ncbi:unnamed protein product [Microthlaspi erraticum]|uniref:Disease resistance protein Roq1-like winged-helix domain-containing protein n=1 Tax=Microthlaspi erraticum TaxID=1685480 RepID=A0A6D2J3S5_9BRAS|nr:unnamed protein product [Microthlaspi erraticum]